MEEPPRWFKEEGELILWYDSPSSSSPKQISLNYALIEKRKEKERALEFEKLKASWKAMKEEDGWRNGGLYEI